LKGIDTQMHTVLWTGSHKQSGWKVTLLYTTIWQDLLCLKWVSMHTILSQIQPDVPPCSVWCAGTLWCIHVLQLCANCHSCNNTAQ